MSEFLSSRLNPYHPRAVRVTVERMEEKIILTRRASFGVALFLFHRHEDYICE